MARASKAVRARRWVVAAGALSGVVLAGGDARAADPDPWFGRDKALHFDASAGIAAASYALSAAWIVDARWKALAIGGGVALAAGAGKELVDAAGWFGGDPSWKDLAWDALGAVAGLALAWGVDLLVGGANAEHPALAAPMPSSASALVLGPLRSATPSTRPGLAITVPF